MTPSGSSSISILYLTTESPYPATSGGRVRSLAQLGLLESLPEVSRITVVSLREEPRQENQVRELEKLFSKVATLPPVFHPIHLKQHPRYVPRVLWERAFGQPYLAGKWASPRVERLLRSAARTNPFEVVYIDHLGMMRYAKLLHELLPKARIVLEQHNVESDFFGQFADKKRGILRRVARLEHTLATKYECAQLKTADHVVAISEEDAERFREMSGGRTATLVPQLVERRGSESFAPTEGTVLYVGNLGWHPNVAGLDWFFREVWPSLHRKYPKVTMRVCGSGLRKDGSGRPVVPALWKEQESKGVTVVGFVDDLAPEYARAAALAAPVVGGSGVRIKLLEGMAYGVPVVTTADGAKGLPLRDGIEMRVAENPETFADALGALALDPKLGAKLRSGAFAYLEAFHGKPVAQARMRTVLGLPDPVAP